MGVNLGENPQNPVNTPLRFWCQKVLPLVYDDSLSYYELLNKVVVYLNNTITDVGNCEYNITQLLEYYNAIRDYVNQRHALLFCNFDIYPNSAGFNMLKTSIYPEGEIGDFVIGKNGYIAYIDHEQTSNHNYWVLASINKQVKPPYGANDISYSSQSEIYETAPTNVSSALAGIENAIENGGGGGGGEVSPSSVADAIADMTEQQAEDSLENLGGVPRSYVDTAMTTAVSTWLAQNITQPSTPAVDASLSVSGAAADSKATGDAIKETRAIETDILLAPELTTFANKISSAARLEQFSDSKLNMVHISGLVPYNGKLITSSGSSCYWFRTPVDNFAFSLNNQAVVYTLDSVPAGTQNETLNNPVVVSGTAGTGLTAYTISAKKGKIILFSYRNIDSTVIKLALNNHYNMPGLELDNVQDYLLRAADVKGNSDYIAVTKAAGKLVNTTSGSISSSASYDTYYFECKISKMSVTCTNGFRAVITTKDPSQISVNGYLDRVIYSSASGRVNTFDINLGEWCVISVANATNPDIDLVTDYVKFFSLPTLRLEYGQKNSFFRFTQSGGASYLYIYYVSGDKVVQWELHNVPASASNSDTWQLGHVVGYDFNGREISSGVEIVSGGEFELAFKEYGADDYCGGNNHGDENQQDFTLFIDGRQISDLSALDNDYHPFDRIDAIEHAIINRCNTPSEDILKHQKIWMFENGTVKVRQTLEFLENLQCDFLCCMLAANRSAFTHGVRQGRYGTEVMTSSTFEKVYTSGNEMMYLMYGGHTTAKVSARLEDHSPAGVLWINNASTLNKLYYNYFGQVPNTSVASGTVLKWESEYDIAYT